MSQLKFRDLPDPDNPGQLISCVEYTEHGSKNRPRGRRQLNLENKTIIQYARPELGDRCHVYLLHFYISKLPEEAFQRYIFYMKSLACISASPSDPWYANKPLGHNTLAKFLKLILVGARIDASNKSNHSLRATAISYMYENNIPEKLIMEQSGHLSRDGVKSYERTTPAQQKAVCSTLASVPLRAPDTTLLPIQDVTRDGVKSYERTTPAQQKAVCSTLASVPCSALDTTLLPIPDVTTPFVAKQEDRTFSGVQDGSGKQEDALDLRKKLQFNHNVLTRPYLQYKTLRCRTKASTYQLYCVFCSFSCVYMYRLIRNFDFV